MFPSLIYDTDTGNEPLPEFLFCWFYGDKETEVSLSLEILQGKFAKDTSQNALFAEHMNTATYTRN